MKLTLTFVGDEKGPKTSLKLDLPTKWLDGPISKVTQTFLSNYNKKNASTPLEEVHLVTQGGEALPEEDLLGKFAVQGDEWFVVRGNLQATEPKAAPKSSAARSIASEAKSDDEDNVTTKAGLEKAKKKADHAFDYSKWDKLDLSDDDGLDCHPNIELASWKRIKAQQRAERRAKEEAEISRLKDKIAKYEARAVAHQGKDEAVRSQALELAKKYQDRLTAFIETRKWVADDVCDTIEDRSVVNKAAPAFPPPGVEDPKKKVIGPVSSEMEFETYDSYVKQHEKLLREFVAIESNREVSERFMVDHPEILNQHADGFLLLLCLDTAMRQASEPEANKTPKQIEKEKRELRRVVRQHLLLNYVLELAKLSKVDDVRAAVRPFFLKTSKQTKEQAVEFENELTAFISRIENRAKEKLAKGEKSPLQKKKEAEEEEYEPAGVGPGGLDPNEVLPTLPKEMQQAFVEQDVAKLKQILSSLPPEEADYHLKRCIDSGLWVVPGGNNDNDDEEEEEEEDGDEEEQAS
jgi:cell division cycle protein 37